MYAKLMRRRAALTRTENGAAALNTTGDSRLDFFSTVGALREADEKRIQVLFAEAYKVDPLFTVKTAFYARDIREGLGEGYGTISVVDGYGTFGQAREVSYDIMGFDCNEPESRILFKHIEESKVQRFEEMLDESL